VAPWGEKPFESSRYIRNADATIRMGEGLERGGGEKTVATEGTFSGSRGTLEGGGEKIRPLAEGALYACVKE